MTEEQDEGAASGARRPLMELSADDVADILGDLPGGQSVSAATRRLYEDLLRARRVGTDITVPAPSVPAEARDIIRMPPVPVRDQPGEQPRRLYVIRRSDATGRVGVGVIMEGCRFSDGSAVYRLLGGPPSDRPGWLFYDNADAPHPVPFGGDGASIDEIVWIDTDGNQ